MSTNYLSPNMSLVIPVPTQELGPNWAYDLNASLTILDGHNHATGSGVQVPTAGININGDLSYNNANNAIGLRSVRFFNQLAALNGASDLGCIYEAGGNFYFNNSAGTAVQITSGSSVSGSSGTITGLPSGTASASFQSGTGTFQFQQATSTGANIDAATVAIRYPGSYPTLSGNYIAIQAPSSLASAYAITLPALPATTSVVTIDTSGNLGTVANSLVPSGSILPFGGASAPSGYLLCDGSAVLRSTYSVLFGVIGVAYGYGNNSTTFNVPDLRGLFLRGVDGGAGRDPGAGSRSALNTGGNTADNVGSYEADAFQGHFHSISPSSGVIVSGGPFLSGSGQSNTSTLTIGAPTNDGSSGAPRTATETRPINVYVNYIIKI